MKLVLIEWEDTHNMPGWRPLEELKQNWEPLLCRSVGWLVRDTKDSKVIVPHVYSEKNECVLCGTGHLCIPSKAIVKMKELKDGKR